MCCKFISRMAIPGVKFQLIPCLSIKPCCYSHLNLNIFFSFLVSTLGVLECTPEQVESFWDIITHAPASDTLLKKFRRTILTQGNRVWISVPANLQRLLCLDYRLLVDHKLTPSFSVDKLKRSFGELENFIQCLSNCFASFISVQFVNDVVVFVLHGLERRKFSGVTFRFVRTILGVALRLFNLSLQTPMYQNDENKSVVKIRMQIAIGKETLAALMYGENPNRLHPQVPFWTIQCRLVQIHLNI